jgi:hypothetical protein
VAAPLTQLSLSLHNNNSGDGGGNNSNSNQPTSRIKAEARLGKRNPRACSRDAWASGPPNAKYGSRPRADRSQASYVNKGGSSPSALFRPAC